MSEVNAVCGCAVNCAKSQKIGFSTAPWTSSRQRSREIVGVRPRSRTGQSRVTCCPGGSRCSSGREVLPVRKRPSCAQRSLVRVSLLTGGGSFSSAIPHAWLFVAMHCRCVLGVAHRRVDNQRQKDHAAEIVIEPLFVAKALEIERDGRRGAA